MARLGYDFEQHPSFVGKKPDYRIEGKVFDNYSPRATTRLRNIFGVVKDKVESGQTRRVSINLGDSDVTPAELVLQFATWPVQGLEEVVAVRDRKVYQIFPTHHQ